MDYHTKLVGVPDADHAELEMETGKGAYVRALGRDLAIALGTLAHVSALRRLGVGPFTLEGDFHWKVSRLGS